MQAFEIEFEGVSELLFGNHVSEKKKPDETDEQFEERTWQQRVHLQADGTIFIPPHALHAGLIGAGKWLGMKLKGSQTFTKRFVSGIVAIDPIAVFNKSGKPATMDDIKPLPLFVPSDGKPGGTKRVTRIFPVLSVWSCRAKIFVVDGKITPAILREHSDAFATFGGFRAMRVQNGGMNGRCKVAAFKEIAV
jgi:hypothetical protein